MQNHLRTFFVVAIFAAGLVAAEVSPPFRESAVGYLTAMEECSLPPPVKKLFILQQQSMPILSEAKDSVHVVADLGDETAVCRIPKQIKFTTMIRRSEDERSIAFKGAMEVATLPVEIKAGEELPVEKESEEDYSVLIKRGDIVLKSKLRRTDDRFKFDKRSAFAKFAEIQKSRGLVYQDGRWMQEAEAAEIARKREEQLRKAEEKRRNVLNGASAGFVVLADGSVLVGRVSGQDDDSIMFEGQGRSSIVKFAEAADLGFDDIVACGRIFLARKLLGDRKTPDFSNAGESKRNSDEALGHLANIPLAAAERFQDEKMALAKIARAKIGEIHKFLDENDLAIYQYKVFPARTLKWHLANGNILLGNSWIKPDQKCATCGGSGLVLCRTCDGKGRVKEKCPHCENGRVKCSICDGEGWKSCPSCRGVGAFSRGCSRCGGTGFISRLAPFRWIDDVEIIGGNVVIRSRRYPLCYYETFQVCPDCGGSGLVNSRCTVCGGTGRLSCPKTEKCKVCDGIGWTQRICGDCNGRGNVRCPDCSGRGFTGDEQKAP